MRLLKFISELNSNGINPTFNDLLQQFCSSKNLLQLDILDLLEKRYLEETELIDGAYSNTGYAITEKGEHAFGRYLSRVSYFISRLEQLYEQGDNDNLYKALEDNRNDMLRFAYFNGLITKAQVEKMAKKLDVSVERIWWGDSQGGFHGASGPL
jgi:hypothetical protein